MNKKEVLVYGIGVNALRFVLQNKNLKIISFIEGKLKSKSFLGYPVIQFEDASVLLHKYYTIIATSPDVYWQIKEKFELIGLEEFIDFTYCEVYNKKMAIIYGNCHTVPIKEGLCLSKKFNSEYGFYPFRQIQNIRRMEGKDLSSCSIENCDLFIHQCIRKNNTYGEIYSSEYLINRLKKNCTVIGIPNVYRMPKFLYPQVNYDIENVKIPSGNNVIENREGGGIIILRLGICCLINTMEWKQ